MPVAERFAGANVVESGRLSPYWGEHAARYFFALEFVDDKTVLDIACGTGYGISILKDNARFVVGVDVDETAASFARSQCGDDDGVVLADGLDLPFGDGTFDVITSFETLEHLHARNKFLAEMNRVLTADGVLVLSTPNANYTKPKNGKPSNPFHVFEYLPRELLSELEQFFMVERFVGQTLASSAGIPPFHDAQQRLPKRISVQTRLLAWKAFNKVPFAIRESLSEMIWHKPFYPTEMDYNFEDGDVETAPVLVAVCRKK